MRSNYDFGKARRFHPTGSARDKETFPPLTKAQRRELDRRLRDAKDPTRYLVVSVLLPKFCLYYNLSTDSWVLNDPTAASLIKNRSAAKAVAGALGPRKTLIKCRVRPNGTLIKSSIPKPRLSRSGSR